MIAAITADGFIAKHSGHISTDWTSAEDKKWFRQRTKEAGVVVMGSTTFDTVGRPMPDRLNIIYSTHPEKYSHFDTSQVRVTQQTPNELLETLKNEKYSEVAILGGSSVYTQWINSGLVTKIYLTVEPVVFGKGLGLFNAEVAVKLQLVSVKNLSEQTLLLEYDVLSSPTVNP